MPNELIPMSTWTPKDGQTYEIVDAEARRRLDEPGQGGYVLTSQDKADIAALAVQLIPSAESEAF